MQSLPLTRRTFVAGCAGAGAVLALSDAQKAFAAGGQIGANARPESLQVHTICEACPNACGYTAYVVDGKLGKVIGDTSSPYAAGNLCARGFGYTQSVYSKSNLKNPLRRKENGKFQTIGWDEAVEEISARLDEIIAGSGAGSVAMVCNGISQTATAYGTRFMHALGSANVYLDDIVENVNKEAAFAQVIGVGSYTPDIRNANLALLVDTSYADVVAPDKAAALQGLREAGKPIVALDPRLGTMASFADEWLAPNPGTELAALLAICNWVIRNNRYDKQFLADNSIGFSEWAQAIDEYTPVWAEGVTGVPSYRIEELAAKIADAAPRVAIEYCNGNVGADAYVNSSQTARVVCLLNTLLGTWNVSGGALLPFDYSELALDKVLTAATPDTSKLATMQTMIDYPLGEAFGASAALALQQIRTGNVRAMIAVESNLAYDYANLPDIDTMLEDMDLLVCISQQMNETAELADYVLPVCSYLNCDALPVFLQGEHAGVSVSSAVIEADDSNALPVDRIFTLLAHACSLDNAFDFSLDEAAELQLAEIGLTLEGLRDVGSAEVPMGKIARIDSWNTPTGKIQFTSEACESAGLPAMPVWVPLAETSNIAALISSDMNSKQANEISALTEGEDGQITFNLITGQQPVIGYVGANVAELMDIADMYDLDSVWINKQIAEILGIETGDTVAIRNENATCQAKAYVTQRIAPAALYLPSYFGHSAARQRISYKKGINPVVFSNPVVEQGYGTVCAQGAAVELLKEGE